MPLTVGDVIKNLPGALLNFPAEATLESEEMQQIVHVISALAPPYIEGCRLPSSPVIAFI